VRTAFGPHLKSDAAAALALVGRPKRLTFAAALRAPLPTEGLDAALPAPGWPELVTIVPGLGSPGPPPAVSAFEAALTARDGTCDLTQRAADSARALAALAAYQGPLAGFIHWLAARSTPPPETTPVGCAPPVVPKLGAPGFSFGSFGAGPGQFDRPTDVAVDANGIYVADQGNSRIEHFTADGRFLGAWGGRPLGDGPLSDGQFITPVGVAADTAGNVYVSDFLGERVQKFTADGRFLVKWGSEGSGDGQFFRMAGIAVGPNGHVYVTDPGNGRIEVFDENGTYLSQFGAPGTGPGQFSTARGIAIDGHGTIYLADRNTGRVEEFTADGTFIRQFGQRGTDPGTFNGVYDIAVDGAGNLWIADLYNYWLQHFTPEGQFLGVVDTFGDGEEFNPFAVATDATGHVYVADIDGGTGDRVLVLHGLD
jgi:streptogramin lyase